MHLSVAVVAVAAAPDGPGHLLADRSDARPAVTVPVVIYEQLLVELVDHTVAVLVHVVADLVASRTDVRVPVVAVFWLEPSA